MLHAGTIHRNLSTWGFQRTLVLQRNTFDADHDHLVYEGQQRVIKAAATAPRIAQDCMSYVAVVIVIL